MGEGQYPGHPTTIEKATLIANASTAVLERLLHYSTTLNINGESHRFKEKRRAGLR